MSVHKKPTRPNRALSRDELADELDLHADSIKRHHTRPNPPPHSKRKGRCCYNAAEYLAWMQSEGLTGQQGHQGDPSASPDLEAARLRKENALASKYELQVARERDQVVEKAPYRAAWIAEVHTIKNKCLGLGAAVAPACYGQDAGEIQRIIDERVQQIFRELAEL